MTDNKLLTVDEVAALLRVRPSCIRRWISERKIEIVHVGRLVRVQRSEVTRVIEQGTQPARRTTRVV
jgi:excisionase family DNA binding protein